MDNQIQKHPVLLYAQSIKDICQPLAKLNITYFSHVRVENKKNFAAISNCPEFHELYLKEKYYNYDIHMASSSQLGDIIIWDNFECSDQTEKMNQQAEALNIRHTFTIVEPDKTGHNYYHFSTHINDKAFNQTYLANLQLLKLFILHFKEKIAKSSVLTDAYNFKFQINETAPGFLHKAKKVLLSSRNTFIDELQLSYPVLKPYLSSRQLEILTWLHKGKTLNQIAEILDIREITVKKHIEKIKALANCYTQFQLGEFFSKFLTEGSSTHITQNVVSSLEC